MNPDVYTFVPTSVKSEAGFTFAELLTAMLFIALVIPTALQGISLANRASILAQRKIDAVYLADRMLNELIVTESWEDGARSGEFSEPWEGYRWRLYEEPWMEESMLHLTMVVYFQTQDHEYNVHLSTVVDDSE